MSPRSAASSSTSSIQTDSIPLFFASLRRLPVVHDQDIRTELASERNDGPVSPQRSGIVKLVQEREAKAAENSN